MRHADPGGGTLCTLALTVEAEPLSNCGEALRSERAFCVDVHRFPLPPPRVKRLLARHTERVAQLGLAGAKLPEHFCQGARFDASLKQLV